MALEEQIKKEHERKQNNLRKVRKATDWDQPFGFDSQEDFDSNGEAESTFKDVVVPHWPVPKVSRTGTPTNRSKEVDRTKKEKQKRGTGGTEKSIEKNGDKITNDDTRGERQSKIAEQPIRWKRRNTLGRGTFGEVILGMNLNTHKLMAVKEIDFDYSPYSFQAVSLSLFPFPSFFVSNKPFRWTL